MTDLNVRPTCTTGTRHTLWMYTIPTVLLIVAMLASVTHVPWPVRIVAAAVLLTVPGAALTGLFFGDHSDPALRLPLTVLSGLTLWLAVTLILNLTGIPIGATSLAIGVGLIGLPATIERQRRRIRDGAIAGIWVGETVPETLRGRVKSVGAVVCSVTSIAVAIVVAAAIQPHHAERYVSLGFVDTPLFVDGKADDAAPGDQVRLNWVMRGYGYDLSTSATSVSVTIDELPVDDIAIDVNTSTEPDEPGASSTVSGAVTFAAPRKRGRYVVALTIVPATIDGTSIPTPGFISTALEVK